MQPEPAPPAPRPDPQAVPPTPEPPAPPATAPAVPPVDYQQKFSESTRENQVLGAKNKHLEQRIGELTNEPTESELRAAFPDWDLMSPTEQSANKRALVADRKANRALEIAQGIQAQKEFDTSIEMAITSHSDLKGREQAFREFVSKPTRRGVPMDDLVKAFLYEAGVTTAPSPTPPAPGLEPGSGGPKQTEKPKTLSGDELANLRKTNYPAYLEYIKTHPIEIE